MLHHGNNQAPCQQPEAAQQLPRWRQAWERDKADASTNVGADPDSDARKKGPDKRAQTDPPSGVLPPVGDGSEEMEAAGQQPVKRGSRATEGPGDRGMAGTGPAGRGCAGEGLLDQGGAAEGRENRGRVGHVVLEQGQGAEKPLDQGTTGNGPVTGQRAREGPSEVVQTGQRRQSGHRAESSKAMDRVQSTLQQGLRTAIASLEHGISIGRVWLHPDVRT